MKFNMLSFDFVIVMMTFIVFILWLNSGSGTDVLFNFMVIHYCTL